MAAHRKNQTLPPRKTAADLFFSTGLYRNSLNNRTPKRMLFTPVDVVSGVGDKADTLFQGRFQLAGLGADLAGKDPWQAKSMPLYWHKELHSFSWLRDFTANGSDAAKRHVRALLTSWIVAFEDYQPHIWDADILSRRVLNWMQQSAFLLTANDGDFNYKFLKSLRRQLQHLKRYCKMFAREKDQFVYYLALYVGAACFKDTKTDARKFRDRLLAEIDKVLLTDGCHISRNPEKQVIMLTDLINLRENFRRQELETPTELLSAIDRLAPAVRFFQHGDGRLAQFNGSWIGEEGYTDKILAQSEAMGRAPIRCPLGGFERLKAGRSLLLVETGEGGRASEDGGYYGIGGFEFSHARDRIIVNCGAHPDKGSAWDKALHATAAHSTLSIGEINAAYPPVGKETGVDVQSHEEGGNLWLEFNNPGYEKSARFGHSRRFYLTADGKSLRGEDTITALDNKPANQGEFTLRFHLHPDLSVSKSMGGRNLLLMTREGVGWQFISSLSEVGLEDSIYCSEPGENRKNHQIVLKGQLHGEDSLVIKWALHQLGSPDNQTK